MAVEIRVPTILRKHVGGASTVSAESGELRNVIDTLSETHPGLRDQLLAEGGELHRFINVYVNDEDVRYLEGLDTKLSDGDVVAILPAVAGGRL
jgi:molybdopterin synthase sulfur carrier subunit